MHGKNILQVKLNVCYKPYLILKSGTILNDINKLMGIKGLPVLLPRKFFSTKTNSIDQTLGAMS
jgi:hypothetical protein